MKKVSSSSQTATQGKGSRTQLASTRVNQIVSPRAKPSTGTTKKRRQAQGLSAAQMRELERRLKSLHLELRDALEGKAGSFNATTLNESIIKGDDAEVAEKQRMSNAALQELDFIKSRLRLVQRAIMKIEEGVYGLCEETEEPIGFERLSVVPWARFAVHVQELRERKMRDFKVSRLRSEA